MIDQPCRPAEHDRVTGAEPDRARRVLALHAAIAEERRVAEGERNDGGRELLLVLVLVQPHAGRGLVEIDQAGIGRMRIAAQVLPGAQHLAWHGGPGLAGLGMRRLVAITLHVRHPAEPPAIGHAHGERFSGARHARREERCLTRDLAQAPEQLFLRRAVEVIGMVGEAGGEGDGRHGINVAPAISRRHHRPRAGDLDSETRNALQHRDGRDKPGHDV